jgi:hypothetical protein
MGPDEAMQMLQQLGITPDLAPMVMEALTVVSGGGAPGGPMPGGPPPGGMPPGAGGPPMPM